MAGTANMRVAHVDMSAIDRAPKGKASGSSLARAAAPSENAAPPVATPLAAGDWTLRALRMTLPNTAPSMPVSTHEAVTSEGEAPIMPACTTASAAVARGRVASLRAVAGATRRLRAAMPKMPLMAAQAVPPRMGTRLAKRMARRAYRPKAKLQIAGASQNIMALPAAARGAPPGIRYEERTALSVEPAAAAQALKTTVAMQKHDMRGCQTVEAHEGKRRGRREPNTKEKTVVKSMKRGATSGTLRAAAPVMTVREPIMFSRKGLKPGRPALWSAGAALGGARDWRARVTMAVEE
mmetsp:Transcript_2637/g.5884  ORF Transcript_2637/g.5884 Transcript_2637/m.5884 type:complete len:295 (-) Transcript_2637:666-1550(-)